MSSLLQLWACGMCTFQNQKSLLKCGMCGADKPVISSHDAKKFEELSLATKCAQYIKKYGSDPNAAQLAKYANCKYVTASKFIAHQNSSIIDSDDEKQDNDDNFPMESDDDDEIMDNNDNFPVLPLIIPNNCSFDPKAKKMNVNLSKSRNKLTIYEPALEFIRSINSKIVTISIAGKARTGKSLVASELYAPQRVPCPFDLGHLMDACTYGIWISAKPIKHPTINDAVVLILDVEGTGFHKATKQNDTQLMVATLLISSYFIYNSKGSFDSSCLEEISFVTELAENIQSNANDEDGDDLKFILPLFMWLLRDVHLKPTINNKVVSVKEYFQKNVLKYERGAKRAVRDRQAIRDVFNQIFPKYDAFTLPFPHGEEEILEHLSTIPRNQLIPKFNSELKILCNKLLHEAPIKVLFSQNEHGKNEYIHCRGTHLSALIIQVVDAVNNPDKIPEISSMTSIIMNDVLRITKKKCMTEYNKLLKNGLNVLRNNDATTPLDNDDIIRLHLQIFNDILSGIGSNIQPLIDFNNIHDDNDNDDDGDESDDDDDGDDNDDDKKYDDDDDNYDDKKYSQIEQQKIKIYNEFCHEIGHHRDTQKIGTFGILKEIFNKNIRISKEYNIKYLYDIYNQEIEIMIDNPEKYEFKDIITKIRELENSFYLNCAGPAKKECWNKFQNMTLKQSMNNFKRSKGFSMKLLKLEKENHSEREKQRDLEQKLLKKQNELQQQTKLMQQEAVRMENIIKSDKEEHEKNLNQAQQRLNALEKTDKENKQTVESQKEELDKMKNQLNELNTKHSKNIQIEVDKAVNKIKNDTKTEIKKLQTQLQNTQNNNNNNFNMFNNGFGYGLIPFKLTQSSLYSSANNTVQALCNPDFNQIVATNSDPTSWIEASFGNIVQISRIDIGGSSVSGGWGVGYINGKVLQYRDNNGNWQSLMTLSGLKQNVIETKNINITASAIRIYGSSYIAVSCLRFYGGITGWWNPHWFGSSGISGGFIWNCHAGKSLQISEGGKRIITNAGCPYVCVSSSTGWRYGVYYWSIQINGVGHGYQIIGVCTNYGGAATYNAAIGNLKPIAQYSAFKAGDIVGVTLNLAEWKVMFHKNGNIVSTVSITNRNQMYYPCMQMCGCNGHDYKLIN